MAEIAELILKADSSEIVKADKDLDSLNKTGAKSDAGLKKLNTTASKTQTSFGRLAGSFRAQKNAAQVSAFQVQDLTVQIQGGVAASRALSQQLPQLLGSFGAGGAILGIFAGIGAIAFAPLIDGLFASKKATDDLEKALETLSDTVKITKDGTVLLSEEFEILAQKSRDVAEVQLKARLITAAKATDAAFVKLKSSVEDFDLSLSASGNAVRGQRAQIQGLAREYGVTSEELLELRDLTKAAISSKSIADAKSLRDRISELALTVGTGNDKFTALADEANKASLSLEQQADITEKLKDAYADLDAAIESSGETSVESSRKATEALEKRRAAAFRLIESEDALATRELEGLRSQLLTKEQAIEAGANKQLEIVGRNRELLLISANEESNLLIGIEQSKQDKLTEIREKSAQESIRKSQERARIEVSLEKTLLQSKINFAGQVAGALADGAKEGSAIQKAAFAAQQAIAVATTILSTEAAATAALAPPPIGLGPVSGVGLATGIRTLGYSSAALQAGLAVGSIAGGRAQGGQVRAGQSYTVGEFGPETLVMGSNGGTVNPSTAQNDSRPLEVVNNIKVIGGSSDAQVTTKVTQNDDRKVIQDIVVDLMGNQSSAARQALHRTSNVLPRGSR